MAFWELWVIRRDFYNKSAVSSSDVLGRVGSGRARSGPAFGSTLAYQVGSRPGQGRVGVGTWVRWIPVTSTIYFLICNIIYYFDINYLYTRSFPVARSFIGSLINSRDQKSPILHSFHQNWKYLPQCHLAWLRGLGRVFNGHRPWPETLAEN